MVFFFKRVDLGFVLVDSLCQELKDLINWTGTFLAGMPSHMPRHAWAWASYAVLGHMPRHMPWRLGIDLRICLGKCLGMCPSAHALACALA